MLKAVPVKPCLFNQCKGSDQFCVADVTYHAYMSVCCQSGSVRCILEQLSFHMILNKKGVRKPARIICLNIT